MSGSSGSTITGIIVQDKKTPNEIFVMLLRNIKYELTTLFANEILTYRDRIKMCSMW